jgi:hypothetical protein
MNRARASIVVYTVLMVLLYTARPPSMFTEDGLLRRFSASQSPQTSLLTFGTAAILLAIVVFFIFAFIDLVFV